MPARNVPQLSTQFAISWRLQLNRKFPDFVSGPRWENLRRRILTAVSDAGRTSFGNDHERVPDVSDRILTAFFGALVASNPESANGPTPEEILAPAKGRSGQELWNDRADLANNFGWLFLALAEAHLRDSVNSDSCGDAEAAHLAWSEACFWSGFVAAVNIKTVIGGEMLDRLQRQQGGKGGKAKGERRAPLREYAQHL